MRNAFSMLELVFVIVIIGILSAIALPKFSLTRDDAQGISLQSDINQAISAIQREIFSQDLTPSDVNGEWILQTAGLHASRWIAQEKGIKLAKNGTLDAKNDCIVFEINPQNQLLVQIKPKADSSLCKKLSSLFGNEAKIITLFAQ